MTAPKAPAAPERIEDRCLVCGYPSDCHQPSADDHAKIAALKALLLDDPLGDRRLSEAQVEDRGGAAWLRP